ncbi:MAG: UMP kinase [Clostridia bacterium]|nr:UMP kinase [Clostridia bacterium]
MEQTEIRLEQTEIKYKRILLKLSGEALSAGENGILDFSFIERIAQVVKKCRDAGVQVAIIVGAGNIWRGRQGKNMDSTRADHMGMLATTINALAIQDVFEQAGLDTRVMTAINMAEFAEPYIRNKAISHLSKGRVVIFGCGLGLPFFSTDTAAVLRAAEIKADIVLLAKNVDGIYSADPKKNPEATRFESLDYKEIIRRGLTAIDSTATTFCMDNHIPILVFGLDDPDNIYRAVKGEALGTIVKSEQA